MSVHRPAALVIYSCQWWSYSENQRPGWYCVLAGLKGANPYDAATWVCDENTAGCMCAGSGCAACDAIIGRALAWWAGGGRALPVVKGGTWCPVGR